MWKGKYANRLKGYPLIPNYLAFLIQIGVISGSHANGDVGVYLLRRIGHFSCRCSARLECLWRFLKEDAAAHSSRDTQQQEKCSSAVLHNRSSGG